MLEKSRYKEREYIELLIQGGSIIVPIREDITYEDISSLPEHLWSFLFFTGYLKKCSETFENNTLSLELAIPNKEIHILYERKIREWVSDTIISGRHDQLYESILNENADGFQKELNLCLKRAISYMDSYENFYHGFLTGLLDSMADYEVRSNRESGNGRGDIFLMNYYHKNIAVVLELKSAASYQALEKNCDAALKQIKDMNYEDELKHMGYQHILKYGIAFYRKDCLIKILTDEKYER